MSAEGAESAENAEGRVAGGPSGRHMEREEVTLTNAISITGRS